MPLSELGSSIPFGEGYRLVSELIREQGSHLWMSMAEWTHPASWADLALVQLVEMYANTHRDEKKQKQPVRLPMPFDNAPKAPVVTKEERDELRERLIARSAFRNR